jgi:type 1 glutamine amidotransferase
MNIAKTLVATLWLLGIGCSAAAWAEAAEKIQVLIVTGNDYPGHVWQETTPAVRQILEQDPRMVVRVIEDPEFLASPALDHYDVIVLHYMNWESPDPSPGASQRLQQFVQEGKGLVLLHFACGAWADWPEFPNLAGRVWDKVNSHDPRGPFRVDVVHPEHPITRGMNSFETDDELYTGLTGQRPVTMLATSRAKTTGQDHPMAFVFDYGQGRVFHTPLGHDVKAFTLPGPAELIRRGTAWAAGREPTAGVEE